MGDPAHVRGESFQKGTEVIGPDIPLAQTFLCSLGTAKQLDGIFPRPAGALEAFSSRLASFCDVGDVYCASGSSHAVHLGYVGEYGTAAANFVLGRIGG